MKCDRCEALEKAVRTLRNARDRARRKVAGHYKKILRMRAHIRNIEKGRKESAT